MRSFTSFAGAAVLNGRLEPGEIPPIVNSWLAGEEGQKEEEKYVEDHHQHISCSSSSCVFTGRSGTNWGQARPAELNNHHKI